jgi:arylsulfatase
MEKSINRRDFIKKTGLASVSISLGIKSVESIAKSKPYKSSEKPHIILIMTDQQRGDTLGYSGKHPLISPNLDALANDGVIFRNSYSSVPSSTPARACLLTGLSPWHNGMLGYGRVAHEYKYEMPRMIRNEGYYTFGIGKMHWYPQRNLHGFHGTLLEEANMVETPGFVSDYLQWFSKTAPGLDPNATGIGPNEHRAGTYLLAEDLHPTYWTGQTAVDLIQNYDKKEPLFLKVSFVRPHSPYDPPKRFLDMYKDVEIPKPYIGDWAADFANYPEIPDAWYGDFGEQHALDARRAYYANITFIDVQIGKIIRSLKDKEMYENSLIFFTADHGDMLGDHYHWRKTYGYQGSANIPMIMKWPESMDTITNRGEILDYPVELRDILPTCLDAIGNTIPDEMDGKSMLALVKEKNPGWRPYIDLEHSTCYSPENYWCGLTDGKMKYIYFFPTGQEQLFDLETDHGELVDLSAKAETHADLELWRQRMVYHLSERGADFVKNNKISIRKEPMLYSPNYPDLKEIT